MQNEMKRVDDTFRELYRKLDFVGSYYENLRVGHPSEFDFNLELQLPISESHIQVGFHCIMLKWGEKKKEKKEVTVTIKSLWW
jgi:hypothetical protein